MSDWSVDFSDYSVTGYVNKGMGLRETGVSYSESGIDFDVKFAPGIFPMYAIDFRPFLDENNIHIEDVTSIDLTAIAYDEAGEEIDLSIEYE